MPCSAEKRSNGHFAWFVLLDVWLIMGWINFRWENWLTKMVVSSDCKLALDLCDEFELFDCIWLMDTVTYDVIQPLSKNNQSFWPVHCPNHIKADWASSHITWAQMIQSAQSYVWYHKMVRMLIFLSCRTNHMYPCVKGIFGTDEDTKFLLLVTQVHHSASLFCRKQQGLSIALVNFDCCCCCTENYNQ